MPRNRCKHAGERRLGEGRYRALAGRKEHRCCCITRRIRGPYPRAAESVLKEFSRPPTLDLTSTKLAPDGLI
jgi:hypothetical protein